VSIDYTVYVGPWFLCRCDRVLEAGGLRWCCVNPECIACNAPARAEMRFCSLCGRTLTGRQTPDRERDSVDADDLDEQFDDSLLLVCNGGQTDATALRPGEHAWLPNLLRGPGGRQLCFGRSRPAARLLLGDLPVQESLWLQTEYRTELAALRDAYGAANVEVGWGVLTYAS
jgi:hypothetical protein